MIRKEADVAKILDAIEEEVTHSYRSTLIDSVTMAKTHISEQREIAFYVLFA